MALGINIKQFYGQTEVTGLAVGHRNESVKLNTVGSPMPEVELKISDAGEILIKGPTVFKGYYQNEEATRKTLDAEGWVHTGDEGVLDEDGQLIMIDRQKDVMRLGDGSKFSPQLIENKLKFSPYINEAMVVGKDRPYIAALIIMDMGNMGKWAENHKLTFTTFTDLSQKPEVYDLIAGEISRINQSLPKVARVKRFVMMYKELDADDDEMTRTRKLRRGFRGRALRQPHRGPVRRSRGTGYGIRSPLSGRHRLYHEDPGAHQRGPGNVMSSSNTAGSPEEYQLLLEDITLTFGGINALSGVTTGVKKGEIFAIIGPNGAGKTCILNCINRFYHPEQGRIVFEGREITRTKPHRIAGLGIARTFQNVELFGHMTVMDNIKLGRHVHLKSGFLSGGIYYGQTRREEVALRREIEETIIDLLEIEAIRKRTVHTLPYGLQKRVELARALAMKPRLLLLDEPATGMNLEETEDMARFILDINEEWGVTIILIEHDMGMVMDISDRICVLDFGRKIAEGKPDEIRHNPQVIQAYLGEETLAYSRLGA